MSDPWTPIGTVIGGGGALALLAAILVFLTRGAIGTAVAQAGAQEIERLKGQLAKELEKERQSFAREVQRESQEAARALERFKSELTLGAEVRRQAAARKVDAVLKVARISDGLIGKVLGGDDVSKSIAALDDYWRAQREAQALVDRPALVEMTNFGRELQDNLSKAHAIGSNVLEIMGRAENARLLMLEAVRTELQLEYPELIAARTPTPGQVKETPS